MSKQTGRVAVGLCAGLLGWAAIGCGGYPGDERAIGEEYAHHAALEAVPVPNDKLPGICKDNVPPVQSPPVFGPTGIMPQVAESCEPGDDWTVCHQHMHCGEGKQKTEHFGGGICGGADCEVHTVYRKPKAGGVAQEVADPHKGTVADNCKPGTHDILVQAKFLDFTEGCKPGNVSNLTYCGSATANHGMDKDHDGIVTCAESKLIGTVVRWCIETQCECDPEGSVEDAEETYGENEPVRVRGCAGPTPKCKAVGGPCEFNYNPDSITARHCCQGAPLCVVAEGAKVGTCKAGQGAQAPPAQCVAPGGVCNANYDPNWLTAGHCCFTSPKCVYQEGAPSGTCQ